jgi:hypothetical protein
LVVFMQRICPHPWLCLNISKQPYILRRGVVSPTPNHQVGGPPLVCCPILLIQYIRREPPISGSRVSYPQRKDAPRRGDKGPT